MSRYSAQILIYFKAYIFQFSISLWVGLGIFPDSKIYGTNMGPHIGSMNLAIWVAFQDCHIALYHCPFSSEWSCSPDNQTSQHALHGLRCSRMKTLSGIYATELIADKMNVIHINGKLFGTGDRWIENFFAPVSYFTIFQPKLCTDFSGVELGRQFVLKMNSVKNLKAVTHAAVKLEFESLSQALKHKNGAMWT